MVKALKRMNRSTGHKTCRVAPCHAMQEVDQKKAKIMAMIATPVAEPVIMFDEAPTAKLVVLVGLGALVAC